VYYSISDVSKQLNVSKVTIYKKISRLSDLSGHVKKVNNGQCITAEGIEIIRKSLEVNQNNKPSQEEFKENKVNDVIFGELTAYKELIESFKKQNENLQEQLKIKDNQISDLTRLLENMQVLSKQQKLIEESTGNKKSFWSRVFNP
jgi:predicted transcriptional regulator